MRIGFFNPYFDAFGGGERYTLTLASHWAGKYDVDIFWDDQEYGSKAKERFNIDLSKVKFTRNIFRSKNLFKKAISSSKYDLIFFLSDGSIPFSLAKRNILHFQNPFPYVKGKQLLNQVKLSKFSAVVCNSNFTKHYIDDEYGVSSKVVYPPVSVKEFKPKSKKNIILSVGRFSKYYINKRQKEMVKFFRNIAQTHKDWELYLVGGLLEQDRPYFEEVKREACDLPIRLLPNEPFGKLRELYGEATIYWHAAGFGVDPEKDPAGLEHFGIAVVEAMAAGCVPMVYNGGGLPEIIADGKSGFLWNTGDELLNLTTKIIRSQSLARSVSLQAQKRARAFDEGVFCEAFDRLLAEIT